MNSLTLTIVNEGADYQDRLRLARNPDPHQRFAGWTLRVTREAGRQVRQFEREPFTVQAMAQAVVELEDYYQRHIAEGA